MQIDVSDLRSQFDRFEAERQALLKKRTYNWVWLFASIVLFVILLKAQTPPLLFLAYCAIALIFIIRRINRYTTKKFYFKLNVKKELVASILSKLGNEIQLHPEKGIPSSAFNNSQLFTNDADHYHSEDLVTGKYVHTRFRFAEVHAQYKTTTRDSRGNVKTSYTTIFDGILFIAHFHKKLNNLTVVRPKIGALFGAGIGSFFDRFNRTTVALENVEFMRRFSTYGSDQIEARYVLTPSLMERILTLEKEYGKRISLSFLHDEVYIAFPNSGDFFEPNINKPITLEQFRPDISLVQGMFDVIESLDLNTRIWAT